MTRLVHLSPEQVIVGTRYRRDLGDIVGLAASISSGTLINPITVDSKHNLIAGHRRYVAWRRVKGDEPIPALVCDDLDDALAALRAERDENEHRKPLAPSEAVALGLALEELERPKAAAREAQAPGAPRGTKVSSGKLPQETGRTRDKVAAAIGLGGRTYEKARAVVQTAADETAPEPVREVARAAAEEMDRTGKVDPAFRKVEAARDEALMDIVHEQVPGSRNTRKTANYRAAASKLNAAISRFLLVDADDFASTAAADGLDHMQFNADRLAAWLTSARKAARGLNIVKGGKR